MPYNFTFDLSKVPRFFFSEIARVSYQKGVHKAVCRTLQDLIRKFRIQEATGLNLSDAVILIQDLIDMQIVNLAERKRFLKAEKKALLLPHCSRKFMDSRCKAAFDPSIPSYVCAHCSSTCLVNKATILAKRKAYDVYVLPGSSCVSKIFETENYEGVIGIACAEEAKMCGGALSNKGIAGQFIPLIKNGCANTIFSLDTLTKTI